MAKWESLLLDPSSVTALPSLHVVKFAEQFKNTRRIRILDIGCGRGRHSIYLAKQPGFEVFALDSASVALEITKEEARKNEVDIKIFKANATFLPFQDCFFDAVIAINVINHGTIDDVTESLAEMNRVLKNEGAFLSTLLSVKDFRFGLGEKINRYTFILRNDLEDGVVHTFFNEKMIKLCYNTFTIREIFEEKNVIRDGKTSYRWIINSVKHKSL